MLNTIYPILKHTHLLLISVSVLFFICRFIAHMLHSPIMERRLVKIAPHVIDSFLLLTGILLCFVINQYPFAEPWLTEKIGAVAAYILLGMMAMRSDRGRLFRIFSFVGALGWVIYAAKLAHFKQAVMIS